MDYNNCTSKLYLFFNCCDATGRKRVLFFTAECWMQFVSWPRVHYRAALADVTLFGTQIVALLTFAVHILTEKKQWKKINKALLFKDESVWLSVIETTVVCVLCPLISLCMWTSIKKKGRLPANSPEVIMNYILQAGTLIAGNVLFNFFSSSAWFFFFFYVHFIAQFRERICELQYTYLIIVCGLKMTASNSRNLEWNPTQSQLKGSEGWECVLQGASVRRGSYAWGAANTLHLHTRVIPPQCHIRNCSWFIQGHFILFTRADHRHHTSCWIYI